MPGLVAKSPLVSQKRGSSISQFTAIVLAAVVAVFISCGVVFYIIQDVGQGQIQEQLTKAAAESVAQNITSQTRLYHKLLHGMSQDQQLIDLFESRNRSGLRGKGHSLLRQIPDAKYVRLLPVGWDELDTGVGPKLSFASLAMLRGVEASGKVSPAEVHQFNSKQQHIALAAPVLNGKKGPVVGVIHLSLPMGMLNNSVAGVAVQNGNINVQQVAGGTPLLLITNDPAGNKILKPAGTIKIPDSIWSVAYNAKSSSVAWSDQIIFYGALLIGLGLIVLVVLLLTHRLKLALVSDQESILVLVERLLLGRIASSQKARVAEMQGIMDRLVHMMHGLKARAAAKPVATEAVNEATGLPQATVKEAIEVVSEQAGGNFLPASIFRSYDIRGVVTKELTADVVYQLGRAIGSTAYDEGQQTVIVARDGRKSGQELSTALCRGLMASGRDVLDIGMVPTPLLYFATNFLGSNTGVMVTGSHNPPEYNGLKIVIGGETISGDGIKALRNRVSKGDLLQGEGTRTEQDLLADYLSRVVEDLHIGRTLKVVIDCGNGVAGVVGPYLLKALGCQVTELYCDVNGDFPNHHPDPSKPENLEALAAEVTSRHADIGIALDGDGDRIGVVDSAGNIIWPDRLLMLFATDLLIRQPGADVIYDVKSSRHLAGQILANGGRPLMWKTGHSLIRARMKETGALLAGELSGHIFFKERWYGFDDGLYACARLLELLSADPRSSAEIFAEIPESVSTPELSLAMQEGANVEIMDRLLVNVDMQDAKLIKIDGIRAEFEYGWGLVRASNTMPALTFRFEAEDMSGLERVQAVFREQLLKIDPDLKLPF
ncbi:MAG: phosphomannomutase/phosphoglucomutase [Gammaproteobacteria bacterium]|nr:phosphomannomutase/phosphoglucomutase [Gammaproteobacteria bacterium]